MYIKAGMNNLPAGTIFFRKPVIDFVKKRKTYKQSNIYAYVFAAINSFAAPT